MGNKTIFSLRLLSLYTYNTSVNTCIQYVLNREYNLIKQVNIYHIVSYYSTRELTIRLSLHGVDVYI